MVVGEARQAVCKYLRTARFFRALGVCLAIGNFGYNGCVLPASRSSNPPVSIWNQFRASILAAAVLGAYALFVGVGLWQGWLGVERAYAYMAWPCLALAGWYGYGFLKNTGTEPDLGLLLSGAGWALVAFGLLAKDAVFRSVRAAARSGLPGLAQVDPEAAPLATFCFLLAFACLLAGAALSLLAARNNSSR
jgi:hypothetical protein